MGVIVLNKSIFHSSLVLIAFFITDSSADEKNLSTEQVSNLFKLPLSCVEVEYPNKLGQVLKSQDDLLSPKQLHPSFYGCFDWHSSVHGHWSLVRLLRSYPNIENAENAKNILKKHLTVENIQREVDYLRDNPSWERPYGWAWLLKLASEIKKWSDPVAEGLGANLQPLADEISHLYIQHLPKLIYPIRVGEHSNTAFGLTFAWDYAVLFEDIDLRKAIEKRALDYYKNDRDCPIHWEPSGYDFLSPCLSELDLMRRILPEESFLAWAKDFLPSLFETEYRLEVGKVSDRTDGKLVHLDGLNFSRAWVLKGLANQYIDYEHLGKIAKMHINFSLPNLVNDGYEGGHWLGSFAIYALLD